MKELPPILLVEDDSTDALLFKRALDHMEIANPLVRSPNCQDALEYLLNSDNARPWIVLTDLNTPQMSGLEFLRAVKDHESLKQTVVIVLSGSGNQRDVAECLSCGAAGYMVKPSGHKQLIDMIRTIHAYWTLSESPHRDR
jgi:DNA-binding response OmpR family regulator